MQVEVPISRSQQLKTGHERKGIPGASHANKAVTLAGGSDELRCAAHFLAVVALQQGSLSCCHAEQAQKRKNLQRDAAASWHAARHCRGVRAHYAAQTAQRECRAPDGNAIRAQCAVRPAPPFEEVRAIQERELGKNLLSRYRSKTAPQVYTFTMSRFGSVKGAAAAGIARMHTRRRDACQRRGGRSCTTHTLE